MKLDVSYLTRRTAYADAVRENMFEGREFGHANDDWERLKAKMEPGDELWYFEPPSRRSYSSGVWLWCETEKSFPP